MLTLREAMDRLIDDAFMRPFHLNGGSLGSPAIDMFQTDGEVVVKAAFPGMKPDEVKISVTGDILTIKGEVNQEDEVKQKAYHLRERRWGSFERSVMLPSEVKSDLARAEFENGILTITLPKDEKAKPRMISIKAK
jgi:HSP20 family protein